MKPPRNQTIDWSNVSMEEIIEFAIADEEDARDYYAHAATLAGNPHTRDMLMKLSVMEQGHADALRAELDELRIEREEETGMAD
jgi:rubrerythrin